MNITTINVELTDRCNKACWCCGRRKREQLNPSIVKTYGDMPIEMVYDIAEQLPPDIFVHLHNNGEPLMYPDFEEAVQEFCEQYTHITTNGKLLLDKFQELELLNTVAISVIENDPEADEQYEIISEYMSKPGRPFTTLRLNGKVDDKRYLKFNCPIARRNLHSPDGSFEYTAKPTVPETGICQDLLYHPAINKNGDISICVRYDPEGLGIIGHVNDGIEEVLDGRLRQEYIKAHFEGRRNDVFLCAKCEYFGIPTGGICT